MPEHVYLSTQLDEFILLPYDAHTHRERQRLPTSEEMGKTDAWNT